MDHEAGDDLDCPVCDGVHELRRSKGVRVKGFRQRVAGTLYVECPEAGDLAVTDDGEVEAVGETDDGATGGSEESGEQCDDWP